MPLSPAYSLTSPRTPTTVPGNSPSYTPIGRFDPVPTWIPIAGIQTPEGFSESTSSGTSSSESTHSPSSSPSDTTSDDEDKAVDIITVSPPKDRTLPEVTNRIRAAIDPIIMANSVQTDPVSIRANLNLEEIGTPEVELPYNDPYVTYVPTLAEMTDHHVVVNAHEDNRDAAETSSVLYRRRTQSRQGRHRRVEDNAKPY
jgi:hypothetical protein